MKTERTRLFRVITLSIPILFFVLLELGLRLSGYGQSLPLFITTPDSPNYILARPDIIKRYFPEGDNIPSVTMEANLFLKQKPESGIRVFVQGGSTAAGFPYGLGASPAGLLDQRLKRTFPVQTVEVINTAMSAVNTYTLLDFADEIIEQKPDAVLIYAGHNEFLGILGVGSNYTVASSHAANLMFLKLRKFRTFQLIQNLYVVLFSNSNSENESVKENVVENSNQLSSKRTFMSKVAKHKNIAQNSDLYRLGLEQFGSNLNLLLGKYKKAGIPVFVATLASNLKDHKPFASVKVEPADQKQLEQLRYQIKDGLNDHIRGALNSLSKKAEQQNNALLHFELATIYEAGKDIKSARKYFEQAREQDLLRFRAPKAMNQIIRESANEHGATLVEYERNLERSSPNGLIGNNFMLEHLHPNIQGYFILADSFYQALKNKELFGSWENEIPTPMAWKDRPVLPAEEYAGYAKVVQLKSDYPFTDKPKKVLLSRPADWQQTLGMKYFTKEISWLDMINQSFKGYLDERNIPMVLKTSKIIADAMPQNTDANFRVGRQLLQDNKPLEASLYFKRAYMEKPQKEDYFLALVKTLMAGKRNQQAQNLIKEFLLNNPNNELALDLLEKSRS